MDTTTFPSVSVNVEGAIYEAALSLEGEEREELLRFVFRGNPRGRAQVDALLAQTGDASAFFLDAREHGNFLAGDVLEAEPPPASPDSSLFEAPGSMIGPYQIVSRIGGGGSGVVYEAAQQSPAKRIVALKVLRPGMDTESVVARFKVECQALALMDHPNIARVYDAGATTAGRPYFVMERVTGERITAACDREQLDIVARIHLFIQVCHGIQHAHQKGVIHRDIKPSNILVARQDGALVPKVIDFGIAKATDPSGIADRALLTIRDQILGTPPYMSPEQVDMSGIDVDTRTDVYSLGALLYELLGGRAPFDGEKLARAGISEMRRILLHVDPPLVSKMLSGLPHAERTEIARCRSEDPDRLVARLRSDLDWIVARAMEKDRNRRYETVNALAADLRRYLSHEPVHARRPSRFYLLTKFVRRNRLACGFGAAVAVSLLGGLGASTTMYLREHEALGEQERLRKVAEAARTQEAWLREQAQARANVSQVAVLVSEGRTEEADELLRRSPLESIEPSREAAGVFRALGSRNAAYGRWKEALRCFVLLDQANRLDNPVNSEGDLLMIAPVLLKASDLAAYEKFRRETLDRYLPAVNSLQAEHLLKVSLLTPAGQSLLDRLAPTAKVCAEGFHSGNGPFPGWEAFAMTLYHFRRGDSEETLNWAQKTLSFEHPNGSREASTLCLRAMVRYRAGARSEAAEDLRTARKIIGEGAKFGPGWDEMRWGSWFSWLMAEIFLEEANREIGAYGLPERASRGP